MTQILELSDKGFKVTIIKMSQRAIMNASETNKIQEVLSKEIEDKEKPNEKF